MLPDHAVIKSFLRRFRRIHYNHLRPCTRRLSRGPALYMAAADDNDGIKASVPPLGRKKSSSATTTICIDGFQYKIGKWSRVGRAKRKMNYGSKGDRQGAPTPSDHPSHHGTACSGCFWGRVKDFLFERRVGV